jgi:thiamine biosynthesis lipoprotein
MRRIVWGGILAALLAAGLFYGRGSGVGTVQEAQRPLMGTIFKIKASGEGLSRGRFAAASGAAFAEVARIEQEMSEWLPESPISRAARLAGQEAVPVSPEIVAVVDLALAISRQTGGVFDISFKPLGKLWKVETGQAPPAAGEIRAAQRLVDYRNVELDKGRMTLFLRKPGMAIGLGGIAKGYAAGRAAQAMKAQGIPNFIVDAGGDLYFSGSRGGKAWTAGIRDPNGRSDPLLRLRIKRDCAVVTSGGYERYFEHQGKRYHHIIDPRTGYPAQGMKSATVLAGDPAVADAFATAFFILGPTESARIARQNPGVAFILIDAADNIWRSDSLSGYADEIGA